MIVQLCGLSGAGKTTISVNVKKKLLNLGAAVEIIDGDQYRKILCKDLGFSKTDRLENIRRLGFVAATLASHGVISIISAINPYTEARAELKAIYPDVKTVYIECPVNTLIARDTKGLYKRASLPEGHSEKVYNLTGINDSFEIPSNPDLLINTGVYDVEESANKLYNFIIRNNTSSAVSLRSGSGKPVSLSNGYAASVPSNIG